MDITIWQVVASAFGGAAFGAIITGVISVYLNRKNYKRDYYKKIIDKRIEAYQELNNFIDYMRIYNYVHSGDENKIIQKAFISENEYNTIFDKLKLIHENTIWLSKDLADMFYDFSNLLIYIKDYVNNNDTKIKYWLSENNKGDLLKKVDQEKENIKNNSLIKELLYFKNENEKKSLLKEIDINAVGIVFFDLIKEKSDAMKMSLLEDLKKLYDVEDFFKDKISKKKLLNSFSLKN